MPSGRDVYIGENGTGHVRSVQHQHRGASSVRRVHVARERDPLEDHTSISY